MKTKASYPFIPSFIAAAAAIIILMPLRIYQYFKVLEPETGFYANIDFSVYLMYAVIALTVVFCIAVAYINRKKIINKNVSLSPVTGAIVYSLGAVGFICDTVSCFSNFINISKEYVYDPNITKWQYISQQGGVIILAEAVFALISAVYFFFMASSYFAKKNNGPSLKTIALALPLWGVARLLIRFKTQISFINVSDLFLELIAITFTMLYLLYFAQTVSEVDNGETYFKMYAYGIPAVVFSLTCFVPRLLLYVIGRDDLVCTNYGVEMCNLLIPIMIIATLVSRTYEGKMRK